MTVPTHNLYDFIHMVTKKRYMLLYQYPFGSRDLHNICSLHGDLTHINGDLGIDKKDLLISKFVPLNQIDYIYIYKTQPVLLCHDQEPLNFDLYLDDTEYIKNYRKTLAKNTIHDPHNIYFNNFNLRLAQLYNIQKSWILLHSEINSHNLARYESTGRFVGAYWWSHAIISRDWYRFAEHDTTLVPNFSPMRLFLVYCRGIDGSRAYRQDFLQQLDQHSLMDNCQTRSLDGEEATSDSSAVYNRTDYNSTGISVVLETVFDERIHLTEKILRPIACGHPFILAAGPGSLELLRRYGFKTFSGYINESYDKIKNSQERLSAICYEMKRIKELPKSDQEELLKKCQDVAAYNQKHFFSDKFFNTVVSELENNVNTAFNTHRGELDLKLWWNTSQWYKKNGAKQVHPCRNIFLPMYRKYRLSNSNNNPSPTII